MVFKNFDKEYFIAFSQSDDYPIIKPSSEYEETFMYSEEPKQPFRPLRFETLRQEENRESGILDEMGDIHQSGVQVVVSEKLIKKIFPLRTRGLNIIPALIIDNQDKWHEDYSYLHFYNNLDCLDLNKSDFEVRKWGAEEHKFDRIVNKFRLDNSVLESIPENERQLFAIGSSSAIREVFFHKNLVNFIVENQMKGFKFFAVEDYEEGMEFMSEKMLRLKDVFHYSL